MKRILCTILFLAAASRMLADPPGEDVHRPHIEGGKWYVQFDLGANYSFLNGNPAYRQLRSDEAPTTLFNSASGLAPLIDATLGYEFSPHFALSLSAAYDGRSASNNGAVGDPCNLFRSDGTPAGSDTVPITKDFTIRASYLSWSLQANFRFDDLLLFVGPTVSVPLAHSVQEVNTINPADSLCNFFANSADATKSITATLDNNANLGMRVSLRVGAGYLIPLTKSISLVPQLAYDIGFSDLLTSPEQIEFRNTVTGATVPERPTVNAAMRLNALQATIGLRINL